MIPLLRYTFVLVHKTHPVTYVPKRRYFVSVRRHGHMPPHKIGYATDYESGLYRFVIQLMDRAGPRAFAQPLLIWQHIEEEGQTRNYILLQVILSHRYPKFYGITDTWKLTSSTILTRSCIQLLLYWFGMSQLHTAVISLVLKNFIFVQLMFMQSPQFSSTLNSVACNSIDFSCSKFHRPIFFEPKYWVRSTFIPLRSQEQCFQIFCRKDRALCFSVINESIKLKAAGIMVKLSRIFLHDISISSRQHHINGTRIMKRAQVTFSQLENAIIEIMLLVFFLW